MTSSRASVAGMWQVFGQEKVVSHLKSALSKGSLSHAYLFTGPPHVGKMTVALELARAVNCKSEDPPCGNCPSCERIASGKHADVQVIAVTQGESEASRREIGIDQIREVHHRVSLHPFEGRCRVFIIDGAEALSTEAANSLLKTLEEPVGRVVFILLSTDDRLLPETIASRCQTLKVSPLPTGEISAYLREKLGVPQDKARLLAHLSRGRIGWAISASQDETLLEERGGRAEEILGLISADFEARFACAARLTREFSREAHSVMETLELMLEVWRDLMLIKLGFNEKIVNINMESELTVLAEVLSLTQVRDFIRKVQAAGVNLSRNVSPRLVLDALMLNMPRREGVMDK